MDRQAEVVEGVGDREQDADAVEREDVDDREVLRDLVVDLDLGRRRAARPSRRGSTAGPPPPPSARRRARRRAPCRPPPRCAPSARRCARWRRLLEVRDAEDVEHHAAAAGGDARRDDVHAVGAQHAGELGEQARAVARDDGELAELALRKVRHRRDQRLLGEAARQLEVVRDVLLGRGEEVAVGHVGEKALERRRRRPPPIAVVRRARGRAGRARPAPARRWCRARRPRRSRL